MPEGFDLYDLRLRQIVREKIHRATWNNRKRRTGESGAGAGKSGVGASVSESRRSVEAKNTSGDGHGRGRASKAPGVITASPRCAGNGKKTGAA